MKSVDGKVENEVSESSIKEENIERNIFRYLTQISLDVDVPLTDVVHVYQSYLPKGADFDYDVSAWDKCKSHYGFEN